MSRGLVANNESAAMPRDMSIWKHGAVKNLFVLRVAALSTHVLGRPFATAQGDTDSTMLSSPANPPQLLPRHQGRYSGCSQRFVAGSKQERLLSCAGEK